MSLKNSFIEKEFQKIIDKLNSNYTTIEYLHLDKDSDFINIIESINKIKEETYKLEDLIVECYNSFNIDDLYK